jgi:hypothetical protein
VQWAVGSDHTKRWMPRRARHRAGLRVGGPGSLWLGAGAYLNWEVELRAEDWNSWAQAATMNGPLLVEGAHCA